MSSTKSMKHPALLRYAGANAGARGQYYTGEPEGRELFHSGGTKDA